jgi:hypothetical protein
MTMTGEGCHTSESANIKGVKMNMNIDDPYDHRELNTRVENYVMAEFVAVSPDFDLKSHLSMREQVGMFEIKNMNLHQANIFLDGIKHSAVFSTMNNALINPNISFFVLNLLNELGLVLKKVDNPLRREMSSEIYKSFAKHWESGRLNYVRGQDVSRISFLIINVVHLFNDEIYKEALDAMENISKFQEEINSTNFKLD